MLVFISDLHISDRTTGVQFLELGAFVEALSNISRQANQAKSKEVTFIFMGDIFDMVRTTYWTVEGEQKDFWMQQDPTAPSSQLVTPWDPNASSATVAAAAAFLLEQRLLARNAAIFDLWGHPLVGRRFQRDPNGAHHLMPVGSKDGELIWPSNLEPSRVYLPGNHDRIVNQWPVLRALAINSLGLNIGLPTAAQLPTNGSADFAYFYQNSDYKVFGRHGQEWDSLNFEHSDSWKDPAYKPSKKDYLDIPIGELIANEFSRLPVVVSAKLKVIWDDKYTDPSWAPIRAQIEAQLNVLDDVRPMAAVVPWLFDSLNTNPVLRPYAADLLDVLLEALNEAATRLENLPYLQDWLRRHNQFFKFDETEEVRLILNSLQLLRTVDKANFFHLDLYASIRRLSQMLAGKTQTQSGNNYEQEALDDLRRVRSQYPKFKDTLYILYGHTHRADQVPLTVPDIAPPKSNPARPTKPVAPINTQSPSCAVYLNTGTWRPLSRQALNQDGFMRWKNITFTLFYNDTQDPLSEAEAGSPTFETWTGSLLSPFS